MHYFEIDQTLCKGAFKLRYTREMGNIKAREINQQTNPWYHIFPFPPVPIVPRRWLSQKDKGDFNRV